MYAVLIVVTKQEWYRLAVFLSSLSFIILFEYSANDFLYAFNWIYDPRVSDFISYYLTAGAAWLSGSNPYANLHAQFAYPPTFLPFFGLFALMGINLASKLWIVSYVALFVVASFALALTLRSERRYVYLALVLLLLLISFPLLRLIELGQIDLLVASLTILSLVCQRANRRIPSAVLLSIATLFKGTAIFLLIYFAVFRRDSKYLLYFVISMLVIFGISLAVVPIRLYLDYLVNVLPIQYSQYELEDSQSVMRLLYLSGLSKLVLQTISTAGIGLFALFALHLGSTKSRKVFGSNSILDDGMFLMNGLIILLFNPRSLIYPYVWVILPLALFLSGLLLDGPNLAYFGVVCIGAFLVNSEPYSPVNLTFKLYTSVAIIPWIAIGGLLLALSLTAMFLRPMNFFHGDALEGRNKRLRKRRP